MWDLNVEGAFGRAFEESARWSGFGRVRGGVTFINESDLMSPTLITLGLTYELSDLSPATVGFQGEILSIGSGMWTQIGTFVDLAQVRPGFMASMGISILGAEVQLRGDDDQSAYWALYGKLRLPLSLIIFGLGD